MEGAGGYNLDQEAIIGIQPDQGNDDAESMVMTAYKLETSTSSTSRMNNLSNFSVSVNLESYNMTGSTATFDVALGIYNSSGTLNDTAIFDKSATLENYYGYAPRLTLEFGSGLSDGTYYIKLLSRLTGDTEWHLQNSANIYYIAATISGNTASFENIAANSILTVDTVCVNGNNRATSTQKIAVSLTNSGTANTNELYAFVDGSLLGGMGVNIDPGTSAEYQFSWTPSSTGTYTISLASDMYMGDVLYTTEVTIKAAVATSLSATFQVDNATGTVITGTTFSGTVTITNDGLAQYYDDLIVCLFYDGGDGYAYLEDYDTYFVKLRSGESYDQAFSFTNLDTSKKYLVMVRYNNQGALTQDNCVSDLYSLSTASGIESVKAEEAEDDGAVYDLKGVRVPEGSRLSKKIYIKGGKKFVGK